MKDIPFSLFVIIVVLIFSSCYVIENRSNNKRDPKVQMIETITNSTMKDENKKVLIEEVLNTKEIEVKE